MRTYLLSLSFIIVTAFSFVQPGFSQTGSTGAFDSAVDYLNYKIIWYRLSGNSKKLTDSLDRLNREGKVITYDQLKGMLEGDTQIPKNDVFALLDEINKLKASLPEDKQAAIDFLTKGIYENPGYTAIAEFYSKRKDRPEFIDYKKKLDEDIAVKLSSIAEDNEAAVVTDQSPDSGKTDANLKAIDEPVPEPNWWKDKIYYILAFIGGGVVALFFQFLFKGKGAGSSKNKSYRGDSKYNELKAKNSDLQISVTRLSRDKSDLEEKISALLKAAGSQQTGNLLAKENTTETRTQPGVNSLTEPLKQPAKQQTTKPAAQQAKGLFDQSELLKNNKAQEFVKEEISPTIDLEVKNIIPKEPAEEKPLADKPANILYFPNPNMSGDFKNAGGKPTFIEGTSIYKFLLISPTEARFEFCEEKSAVATAINNRNDLILSVAEESNAYTPNATKILIADNQKGKAVLEGLSWRITDKAKIKYI